MNKQDADEVKRQLIENIDANFPGEKGEVLKRQIVSMSDEQLESFLEKNSMKDGGCIFCSIASGKSESFKVGENDSAVAILDINPASRGHVLIIPKEHIKISSFTPEIKNFAGTIAQLLKERLNPKDIEISSKDLGEHGIMNLVPIYADESINGKRQKADKEQLKEVFEILAKKPEAEAKKPEKERKPRIERVSDKKSWLPKRIP